MCGIVGLFLKNPELEAKLGAYLAPMLIGMSERGPDSAGFAVYRPPAAGLTVKLTLHHPDERYPWQQVREELAAALSARVEAEVRASHCVLASDAKGDAIRSALAERHPEVRLIGIGETIEIFKEKGLPEAVAERFRLAELRGSHAIGQGHVLGEGSALRRAMLMSMPTAARHTSRLVRPYDMNGRVTPVVGISARFTSM